MVAASVAAPMSFWRTMGQPGCSQLWGPAEVGHTGWVGGVQVDSSETSFSGLPPINGELLVPPLPLLIRTQILGDSHKEF